MTYTRKAFYGFLWMAVGMGVAQLFGYALRVLLARSLTLEEYGLLYAIVTLFGFIAIFQNLGLSEALIRYTAVASVKEDAKRIKEYVLWVFYLLLGIAALVALIALFAADWLATVYFKDLAAAPLVRLYAIVILLAPVELVVHSVLVGRQRLDLFALSSVLKAVALFILTWILLSLGIGLRGAIWSYVITYAAITLFTLPLLLFTAAPGIFSAKTLLRRTTPSSLVRFGLPLMVTSVSALLLTSMDTILLTLLSSLKEVGLFQIALPTASILLIFVGIFTSVLLPLSTELWTRRKKELLSRAADEISLYAFVCVFPLASGFILFPEIILRLLFGISSQSASYTLTFLSGAIFLLTLNSINAAILAGIGKPRENVKAVLIGAFVNLFLALLLIPLFGGAGAALATFLSSLVIWRLSRRYIARSVQTFYSVKRWMYAVLSGLVFTIILFFGSKFLPFWSDYARVIITLVVSMVVYCALLFSLKVITAQELKSLSKRIVEKRL